VRAHKSSSINKPVEATRKGAAKAGQQPPHCYPFCYADSILQSIHQPSVQSASDKITIDSDHATDGWAGNGAAAAG
jgi:hypothetical protein